MAKYYKDFPKHYIGESDIAALILVGCGKEGLNLVELSFGGDGAYDAYIIDDKEIKVPEHYELVGTFDSWLKIYDDSSLVKTINGDTIEIYRAGGYACLIKIINRG